MNKAASPDPGRKVKRLPAVKRSKRKRHSPLGDDIGRKYAQQQEVAKDLAPLFPDHAVANLMAGGVCGLAQEVLEAAKARYPDLDRATAALVLGLPVGKISTHEQDLLSVAHWTDDVRVNLVYTSFLHLLSWQQRLAHKARKLLDVPRNSVDVHKVSDLLGEILGLDPDKRHIYEQNPG